MAETGFYAAGPDEQVAINLFAGWGYNFYRAENQLRADDLLVRARVGEILAEARSSVQAAETALRHARLGPPTREHPRPDPEAVRAAQALEALGRTVGALEGQIRALPVPETDRMTQRLREERQTLERLLQADCAMVMSARRLRDALAGAEAEQILGRQADLAQDVAAVNTALLARREILQLSL